jgi:serine/threonine protein kinase
LLERPKIDSNISTNAADLLNKIFEKDPQQRIKIADILSHPWL